MLVHVCTRSLTQWLTVSFMAFSSTTPSSCGTKPIITKWQNDFFFKESAVIPLLPLINTCTHAHFYSTSTASTSSVASCMLHAYNQARSSPPKHSWNLLMWSEGDIRETTRRRDEHPGTGKIGSSELNLFQEWSIKQTKQNFMQT